MFEEQYHKYCQEIKPSDALNDETLALMQEARDHRATEPPRSLRWKPAVIIPVAGTAAAAVAALVLVGVWMTRSTRYEDMVGDLDQVFSNSTAAPESESADQEPPVSDPAEGETAKDQDDSFADTKAPEESPTEPSAPPADENKSEDLPEEEPSYGSIADEGEDAETKEESTDSSSTADPRGPEIINDETTQTFTTIREFLNGLTRKETVGYGSNYYNARELIIVPSKLPDQARFRHFHLNTETGKYSYGYIFTKDGTEYFLDIEVNAKTPKTLRDLNLQKEAIAEEEIRTGKKEDQLFYLFGYEDEVTVTVSEVNSIISLTEEEVAALLEQFELERCSLTNTIIDMKYEGV